MLNSKRGNIIISIIIAIALWVYVVGEVNPQITKTYSDIPIKYINGEYLDSQGLAVLETSESKISVTLSGSRSDIRQTNPSDISAVVDLSEAAKGENEIKISIIVPDNVEITDKSINKVTVVVENQKTVTKKVKIKYIGEYPEKAEPTTIKVSADEVSVTGAASKVDDVEYVKAEIPVEDINNKEKTIKTKLIPVDKTGKKISNLELSVKTVEVTSVLEVTKTVKLNVSVVDNKDGTVKRTTTVPKTIIIKGISSDLKNVSEINAKKVDISNVTTDTSIKIEPILPKGIEVSSKSADLFVSVNVENLDEKKFTFSGDSITLKNLGDGYDATVKTDEIIVTVIGSEEDLKNISKDDIKLSADLSNVEKGISTIDLKVECEKDNVSLKTNKTTVRVEIKER